MSVAQPNERFFDAILDKVMNHSELYSFRGEDILGITEKTLLDWLRASGWKNIPSDYRFERLAQAAGLSRIPVNCYRNGKVSTAKAYVYTIL